MRRRKDSDRLSSHERGYGARWKKVRRSYLRSNPLCVECQKMGIIKAARVVDHIKPHKGDMDLFWDEGNWQSLCEPCHNKKTAREDGAFGNPAGSKDMGGCNSSGLPLHPDHPWNKA